MADLYDISLRRIDGTETTLAPWRGKVLLIVNVASKCGLTPQYEGLERLYTQKRVDGLEVLGFPCNQFREQEPGTESEIAAFCSATYGVDFPLFAKIEVNGERRHPLYRALLAAQPEAQGKPGPGLRERLEARGLTPRPGDILWNFEKFLVARDGRVAGRFAPDVTPEDALLSEAVEHQIAA